MSLPQHAQQTHSLRTAVATILDTAGLSAEEIADYLGHEGDTPH